MVAGESVPGYLWRGMLRAFGGRTGDRGMESLRAEAVMDMDGDAVDRMVAVVETEGIETVSSSRSCSLALHALDPLGRRLVGAVLVVGT